MGERESVCVCVVKMGGKEEEYVEEGKSEYGDAPSACEGCGKMINKSKFYRVPGGFIHALQTCQKIYHENNPIFCAYCKKEAHNLKRCKMAANGDRVHDTCIAMYQKSLKPNCVQCGKPFSLTPPDNGFYPVKNPEGGVVHTKCFTKYQMKHAPKCHMCKKSILTGYYKTPDGFIHGAGKCLKDFTDAENRKQNAAVGTEKRS